MLTKREYCESLVCEELLQLEPDKIIPREEAHNYICQSSTLAVALEYLGELSPREKEYSSTRGGTVARYIEFTEDGKFKNLHILSIRELIDLLPETVNRGED